MKKLLLVLVLIGVCLIVAASLLPAKPTNGTHGYEYDRADRGSLKEVVTANGPLEPQDSTIVGSVQPGEVVWLSPQADFNKHVKKGEVLLELDDRLAKLKCDEAKAAVESADAMIGQARAKLQAAEVQLKYQEDLLAQGSGVGKRSDKERAEMEVKAAEAGLKASQVKKKEAKEALRQAELNLDLTKVRAPFDGTILERKVNVGQMIAPPVSAQLFTLAKDLSHLQVHALVAEGDVSKLKPGLEATFTVYAYSDANVKFPGTVTEIRQTPTNVQGAIYYEALIDVENKRDSYTKEWMLRPGMTASVDILCRKHDNVWKIPASALNFQLDPHFQTEEAKAKIEKWDRRSDIDNWKLLWVMGNDQKPWPVYARTGGEKDGQTGITDGDYTEVLEWDPDPVLQPLLKEKEFEIIIKSPPAHKPRLFERMNVKVF